MTKLDLHSVKGDKISKTSLPKNFQEENLDLSLLAQAVHIYESNSHKGLVRTKTRGEVRRTGRKVYRQKGTGYARHGARSAPIFVGGGVAHGPTGVRRVLSLPLKMRTKALNIALSLKVREGKVILVEGLTKLKKAKDVFSLLRKLELKAEEVLIVSLTQSEDFVKAVRNLQRLRYKLFKDINAYDVFTAGRLIFDSEVVGEKRRKK